MEKNLNVKYFRVFGCIANVHIPDRKRAKLDEKSHRCVFLGVSDESKAYRLYDHDAYRLYDPDAKRVIISRDVMFEENESWNWTQSTGEVQNDVFTWEDIEDGEVSDYDDEEGRDNDHVQAAGQGTEELGGEVDTAAGQDTEELGEEDDPAAPHTKVEREDIAGSGERVRRAPRWMED